MSKEHNNLPARQGYAKSNLSYDLMKELRKSVFMHTFRENTKNGTILIHLILNYRTDDGRIHQLTKTSIEL